MLLIAAILRRALDELLADRKFKSCSSGQNFSLFHEILQSSAPQVTPFTWWQRHNGEYVEGVSDINSIIVLQKIDLGFLDILAPWAGNTASRGSPSRLIMDPATIKVPWTSFH